MTETPIVFGCAGEELVGVITAPASPPETALLVIVGGPQYRAGSHRQFVQLAHRAAELGFAAMRFDVRGMGDSGGAQRSFEDIDDDVAAAIDAIQSVLPSVKRVGLWGLCGGASAALLYCRTRDDARVAGVSLVNPWVRSEATQARTRVKHYYVDRLRQPAFWKKLLSGQVATQALGEFMRSLRLAAKPAAAPQGRAPGAAMALEDRMAEGLARFHGEALILLSGNDYTAKEFLETVQIAPAWQAQMARPRVRREDVADADHTFSQPEAHQRVELATMQWLERIRAHV